MSSPEAESASAALPGPSEVPASGAKPHVSRSTVRQVGAVLLFLIVATLFTTNFQLAVVRGESMLPTYHDGQVVLARRLGAIGGPNSLHRGDVVIFGLAHGHDTLIKRVAFLPGDVIPPPASRAFWRVREYFGEEVDSETTDGRPDIRLTVPKGYFVVLGDNRRISDDSRMFGPVSERDLIGRVVHAPPAP